MAKEYKFEDGEKIELSPEELADLNVIRQEYQARKQAEEIAAIEKAAARAAILERLGLTEEEAKVLLG